MEIIYETDSFLALNKPAGILTHRLAKLSGREFTVADWFVKHYPLAAKVGDNPDLRPGIVHRLDKDTSGVLVLAKTQPFFNYFKSLLAEGLVKKTYWAIVYGRTPKRGVIDRPIGLISGGIRRSVKARKMKMVKPALTEFYLIRHFKKSGDEFSLLEVYPKTGRTHQIRVHLAYFGYPVVGDKLYAPKKKLIVGTRHLLHARSVEFNSKNGSRLKIEAEPPADFTGFLT